MRAVTMFMAERRWRAARDVSHAYTPAGGEVMAQAAMPPISATSRLTPRRYATPDAAFITPFYYAYALYAPCRVVDIAMARASRHAAMKRRYSWRKTYGWHAAATHASAIDTTVSRALCAICRRAAGSICRRATTHADVIDVCRRRYAYAAQRRATRHATIR